MSRRVGSVLLFLVVVGALPIAAAAQQQAGTITGRVTTATGQPLSDTRLQVVGTTRGAMSGADGSYRITGVPPGPQLVRALRIGYGAQTRTVAVEAGGTAEASFTLSETAAILDQVVVTATGATQRRREAGVSVGTIDTSMVNVAATPLISNILASRTPGVTVQQSSGTTGTGSRIRIRGSNSINQSNEPLIIVDGTRVNNSPTSFSIGVGGQTISRIEDFNPEDLETVDVIKGPAAAALYGTAAANGVIQITTKKGRAGRTRWNAYEEYGTVNDVFTYPTNWNRVGTFTTPPPPPALPTTPACTLEREVLGICVPKPDSILSWNPIENISPFRQGWRQTHGISASGGTQAVTYFVSGEYEREQGVYDVSQLRRITGRSNVRMQLRNDLDATLAVGLVRHRLRLPYNDNSAFGAIAAGFLGKAFDCSPVTQPDSIPNPSGAGKIRNPNRIAYCGTDSLSRGYFNANVPSTQFFNVDNNQQNDRLTASLQSNYTPLPWLRAVGLLGLDILNRLDEQLFPPGKVFFSNTTLEGSRFQARIRVPTYNMNGSVSATYGVPGVAQVQGQTTVGGQFVREDFRLTSATGAVLLPGTAGLDGASARFAVDEDNQEVITLGYFLQQQFTHADRLFLTLAVRTDRNSAFGTKFSWVTYPAANVSWVISDESFFPRTEIVDQLRLRAGWGQSGQRPVFRDAVTFFSPVSVRVGTAELPAITIGGTGNPNLSPELTTELEGGFEATLFRNRLSLELTGYAKSTRDAIVAQRLAPSLGATNTRLVNLGEVENRGVEALATVKVLNRPNLEWNATVAATANRNRLVTLGKGITPIAFGFNSTQQHRDGYPLGGYFERKIVSYQDLDGNGILTRINCPSYAGTANPQLVGGPRCEIVLSDSVEYLGSPIPTREASLNTDITLFRYARISTLFAYRGGYKIFNSTAEFRCTLGVPNCLEVYDKNTPLAEQARVMARYMGNEVGYIEDASFLKWRELALTLSAPTDWARRLRVEGLSLTLAGRNLATWTDYTGLDPEVNSNANVATNAGGNFTTSDFLGQPPVRYYTARLNVNF
jgi:TonB-linked SusC/RagA family outer membrane protein